MFDNYYSTLMVAKERMYDQEKLAERLSRIKEAKLANKNAKKLRFDKLQPEKRSLNG